MYFIENSPHRHGSENVRTRLLDGRNVSIMRALRLANKVFQSYKNLHYKLYLKRFGKCFRVFEAKLNIGSFLYLSHTTY